MIKMNSTFILLGSPERADVTDPHAEPAGDVATRGRVPDRPQRTAGHTDGECSRFTVLLPPMYHHI